MRQIQDQIEKNFFTEMCSGSEANSCFRLIDCVYHSTLGLGVIKKKRDDPGSSPPVRIEEGFRQRKYSFNL